MKDSAIVMNEQENNLTKMKKIGIGLLILFAVVLVVVIVWRAQTGRMSETEVAKDQAQGEWEDVTIIPEAIDFVYTDEGFASNDNTGDTETVVTVINRSDSPLSIVFPTVESLQLQPLQPGEEITLLPFEQGVHEFHNADDPSQTGTIEIQ